MQIAMTDRMAKYRARWAALAAAAVFLLCLCGCMGRAAATEAKVPQDMPETGTAAPAEEAGGYTSALYWKDQFYAGGTGGRMDRIVSEEEAVRLNTGVESDILCLYGDERYLLAGLQDGTLLLSEDGTAFQTVLTGLRSPIHAITYFGGQYYLALENGYLLCSKDAVAWQATQRFTEEPIISLTSNDAMLFAISASGDMIRTTDGVNWRTSNFNEIYAEYYDPMEFDCIKALGDSFFLLAHYRDDPGEPFLALTESGDIWMQRALTEIAGLAQKDPFYLRFHDIGALGDQLVTASSGGQLVAITECSVCHTATQVCESDLRALAFHEDTILAVGDGFACVLSDTRQIRQYTISAEQALKEVKDGAVLVDVRGSKEYQAGHIQGAINLPLDDLEQGLPEIAAPEDTVVFYCQVGTRSQAAVQKALDLGYGQVYTAGGIEDWPYELTGG